MPPHKSANPFSSHPASSEEGKIDDAVYESNNRIQEQDESDSDGVSHIGEKNGFVTVNLVELRKEVQCPICLGIIRKTRAVMECLHRFCRECIDKSMRLGNNECPACRTHCASRRSLRDDPNFDALIAAMFPDIDKYEEDEMAFNDEDIARNKEIQDSIAQTVIRQTEDGRNKRPSFLRDRRNNQVIELDEIEDANEPEDSPDSSSSDDGSRKKKYKRRKRKSIKPRTSKRSLPIASTDDDTGVSAGVESLTWGKARVRSNSRLGGPKPATNNTPPNTQTSDQQVDRQQNSTQHESMNLTLITMSEENIPSLSRPYIRCNPALLVKHLCQYIGKRTYVEASEIEIMIITNFHLVNHYPNSILIPRDSELQMLNENQTVGEIHACFPQQDLVLAYRRRMQGYGNGRY